MMDYRHDTEKLIRAALPGADCGMCGCRTCDEAARALAQEGLCAPACVRLLSGRLKEIAGLLPLHCGGPGRCCSAATPHCYAFERLYAIFRGTILKIGRRHRLPEDELEDLVQQTMLELWTYCSKNRVESVWPLLVSIAHRKAQSRITHRARVRRLESTYHGERPCAFLSAYRLDDASCRAELSGFVEKLPPRTRQVAALVWLEGRSVREAAQQVGSSEKTVYNLLERAKVKIRRATNRKLGE